MNSAGCVYLTILIEKRHEFETGWVEVREGTGKIL